jgi:hypothetical protein
MKLSRFTTGFVLSAIAVIAGLLVSGLPARAQTADGAKAYPWYGSSLSSSEWAYFDDWRGEKSSPDDWLVVHDGRTDGKYLYVRVTYKNTSYTDSYFHVFTGPSGTDAVIDLPDLKDGWTIFYNVCRGRTVDAYGREDASCGPSQAMLE